MSKSYHPSILLSLAKIIETVKIVFISFYLMVSKIKKNVTSLVVKEIIRIFLILKFSYKYHSSYICELIFNTLASISG